MVKSKGIWQPLVLAALLGAGFAVPWWGLASLVQAPMAKHAHWEQLLFRLDGTPVIRSEQGFRDVAGRELDLDDQEPWLYGAFLDAGAKGHGSWLPVPWDQRLRGFVDTGRPPGFWYFVWDGKAHGSAYLVGYHSKTSDRLGFIGTGGFRPDEPPPEQRFPVDALILHHLHTQQHPYALQQYVLGLPRVASPKMFAPWLVYVPSDDDKIYQIDLGRRTATIALEVPALRSTAFSYLNDSPTEARSALMIRTRDGVLFMNPQNQVSKKVTPPTELRDQAFSWAEIAGGTAVAWTAQADPWETGSMTYQVYSLDASGRVTRRQEIVLDGQSSVHVRYMAGVFVPAPLVLGAYVGAIWPLQMIALGESSTMPEAAGLALARLWPSLLFTVIVGAGLSWRCYLRQMRYGAGPRERILWPIVVFAFGLFGWIGYRCHRSWPPLESCPACRTAVPRDRLACAACRADFPLPATKGTEVFA